MTDFEKPREKALREGMKALSDSELMAIVFGTGIQGKDVFSLCDEIVDDNKGHMSRIASLSAREFMERYKGIGPAKALTLLAGIELGVRAAADAAVDIKGRLTSSKAAFDYMYKHFYKLDHEQFWVLLLSNALRPLREIRVGQGGLTATVVDPKIIFKEAVMAGASAIMLFHNHPSGNLEASVQDRSLTSKIGECARLFDIRLLDHIICGNGQFYSFHDNGIL